MGSVLEPLLTNVKTEEPDILELCHLVSKEVLSLGGGKGYDVEHDREEEQAFNSWLQCYYKDGMQNLVDHNGRTIWFSGPPGPMKPTNSKSRGKRSSKNETQLNEEDHDYSPKKAKKAVKTAKKAENGIKKEENGSEASKKKVVKKKPTKSSKSQEVSNPNRRVTRSASKD